MPVERSEIGAQHKLDIPPTVRRAPSPPSATFTFVAASCDSRYVGTIDGSPTGFVESVERAVERC
jgi:hypothetical protein